MCRMNFVGNGSSALMRRALVLEVGGYDSSLRARGAEGCEDLMLYMSIAEHHEVGLVRKPLTGYRVTAYNMSSRVMNMYRSAEFVFAHFRAKRPEFTADLAEHHDHTLYWLVIRALLCGNLKDAVTLARMLVACRGLSGVRQLGNLGPFLAYALMPQPARDLGRRIVRTYRKPRPHFLAAAVAPPA
jgi:hypothetical protein